MRFLALGAILLVAPSWFLVSAAPRQEQQQSPPPPPTPAQNPQPSAQQTLPSDAPVAKRKVWTNDDVVQLRTPADNYLAEKEARQAAEAAAAKSAAQPRASSEAPPETKLPTSVEETQLLIKNKEQDISDDQASLASLNVELATVADERKKAKQKEIEIVAAELDRARNELKALQAHLVELQKPPASESTAAPPPPD